MECNGGGNTPFKEKEVYTMSLVKQTVLTIAKNNTSVKLSNSLKFYKNDSLTLLFEIQRYNFEIASHERMSMLSAVAFIETPEGEDSINVTILDGNTIRFDLTSRFTQQLGTFRMQFVVRDNDGCQSAIPFFEFEVQDLINDSTLLVDNDGNVIVTEESVPVAPFGKGFNRITDLEEATELEPETSYVMVTKDEHSYKVSAETLMKGNPQEFIKFKQVTRTEYRAIETKEVNVMYLVTDENKVYLGAIPLN